MENSEVFLYPQPFLIPDFTQNFLPPNVRLYASNMLTICERVNSSIIPDSIRRRPERCRPAWPPSARTAAMGQSVTTAVRYPVPGRGAGPPGSSPSRSTPPPRQPGHASAYSYCKTDLFKHKVQTLIIYQNDI